MAPMTHESPKRCEAEVFMRDTYRYSGGRHRFQLHYTAKQCARRANGGDGFCWQHAELVASFPNTHGLRRVKSPALSVSSQRTRGA